MIHSLLSASRARAIAPPPEVIPPPTNGVVDDVNNTFDFTFADGYPNMSDYEFTITGGLLWSPLEVKPISVGNKDIDIGFVEVRTIDRTKEMFSAELYNEEPFTYTEPVKSTVAKPTGLSGDVSARTFTFTVASGLTIDDYEFCYGYNISRVWRPVTELPYPLNVSWGISIGELGVRVKETDTRWPSEPSFVPVAYPERTPTVVAPTLIINQELRLIDFRHPLGMWARDSSAQAYWRVGTKIGLGAYGNIRPPVEVPNTNTAAARYGFRFQHGRSTNYTANGIAYSPAFPAITTTPSAPVLIANDINNTISAWSPLGDNELLISINNGAYQAYTGIVSVGNVARAAGYYKFKTKSSTNRNESPVANSPAFTVGTTGETFTYTLPLELA